MSSEAPARAEIPIIYGWRKYIRVVFSKYLISEIEYKNLPLEEVFPLPKMYFQI